jgi:hypothetical protein
MVSVDGKKMTKSTYDQIREENPLKLGKGLDFESQVLGYVFDTKLQREIVLYINESGELRKTSLYPVKEFATKRAGFAEWYAIGFDMQSLSIDKRKEVEQRDEVKELISQFEGFWELLIRNQVFIAT